MFMARFHPLATILNGKTAWCICDGYAKGTEHTGPLPYREAPEPCRDRDEALELCDILNEEHEQNSANSR